MPWPDRPWRSTLVVILVLAWAAYAAWRGRPGW